jgi:hypothetical protein
MEGTAALLFRGGALAKALAGGPWLLAGLFDSTPFLEARLHEYGTMLLQLAGLFNLLAVANAFELRTAEGS